MRMIHQLRGRGRRSGRQAGAVLLAAILAASAGGFAAPVLNAPIAAAQAAAPPISSLFTCQGGATQTYTVPDGITRVFVAAVGGAGAGDKANSSKGGVGAVVEGAVPVLPGDQIGINVGCAADQRQGGAGGTGFSTANGGKGGSANVYQDGGGGGGASGVFDSSGYNTRWHVYFQGFDFVAGGGGGGSGGAGLSSGNDGGNGALTTPHPQNTPDGGRGLGSAGGGGGGGGGGGYLGGGGGGGGNRLFGPGHAGDGGASTVPAQATNTQVVSGGGPRGNGFVLITPLLGQRPAPTLSLFNCQGSATQPYTAPAGVSSLQVLVEGAGGGDLAGSSIGGGTLARGGAGAQVQTTVPVSAGQTLGVDVGCRGGGGKLFESGGPGYGKGGDGGTGCDNCDGNPDGVGGGGGSAILDRTGQPLVVAGGGAGGQGDAGRPGSGGDGGSAGDGSALGNAGQPASGGNHGPSGSGVTTGSDGAAGGGAHCAITGEGVGAGGGGGGGYRGGNGGHSGSCAVIGSGSGGGGAGGSSFLAPAIRGTGSIVGGVSHGDGLVVIAAAPAGVPLAPTLVQATGSPLQATVSFVTPSDDGGSPITSYTVTSYPGGVTTMGTGSPIVVTGLTQQAPYTFTVHATNAVGNSAESAPSNAVTTVFLPGAPSITAVTAADSQVTVAFTPPASDGGRPITQYTAIARPGAASSGPVITATGTTSPLTIGGLTNGATYSISVYATTALGNSPESVNIPAVPRGLPGAPTGVSAAVEPGGVSVAFTPPSSTGGSPIDAYTVTSSPGGITATGTTSPIVVTGLTNGTTYTFTVHATTSAGNGPESAPSNAVTWVNSTALSPPLFPSAAPGNQQATVSFHPPLDDGGSPVTSYIVTSSPGGITATGTSSPLTVTGLTNGVSYTFAVVAVNANGTSQPSTPSNAVTPSASYGPPNDDFANAQPISGDVGSVTGTNVEATKEPGEPDHNGNPGGASVWYVWTTTHGGSIEFNTCHSSFPTELGLYMGSAVDALTGPYGGPIYRETVNCLDGTTAPAVISDVAQGGGTFYIAVDGANTGSGPATGNIVLNWTTQTGQ